MSLAEMHDRVLLNSGFWFIIGIRGFLFRCLDFSWAGQPGGCWRRAMEYSCIIQEKDLSCETSALWSKYNLWPHKSDRTSNIPWIFNIYNIYNTLIWWYMKTKDKKRNEPPGCPSWWAPLLQTSSNILPCTGNRKLAELMRLQCFLNLILFQ